MKKILKLLIVCAIIVLTAFSCEKTEEEVLPANQAKGRIIQVLFRCYGSGLMIEVENPKGIGKQGTFKQIGTSCPRVNYKNAILVPCFSRIPNLNTEAIDSVGTWLHFEYRELTDEERNSQIFVDTSFHGICNFDIIGPSVNRYIITNVIEYH
ncbi:MAG: hypothetical protein J7L04_01565 [Bacteroidales bacterium]|nr:hypothetical protein [Bacteroidales bacterium]